MEELISNQKRDWVKGLLIGCPFGKPLDNCPLEKYRSLTVSERFTLADNMNEKQIDEVIIYHQSCLRQREKINS